MDYDQTNPRITAVMYIAKRIAIRSSRIAIGLVIVFFGFDYIGDAIDLSKVPFSQSSISTLLKTVGSFVFGAYLVVLSAWSAFGAGPQDANND